MTIAILQTGTTTAIVATGTTTAIVTTEVPVGIGVDIQGTHAVADLRGIGAGKRKKKVLTFGVELIGAVSTIRRFEMSGAIQTESTLSIISKVMTESAMDMKSRLMIPHRINVEATFHSHTEAILPHYKEKLKENITYLKLRKILNTYRALMDRE